LPGNLYVANVKKCKNHPMKIAEILYSQNIKTTGTKNATQTATTTGFLTLRVNQMGKMNGKYLNRERWFAVVKTTAPKRLTA